MTCFLCLKNCQHKVCTRCSILCHPTCWGKYVKNTYPNLTHYNGIICPQCKLYIKRKKPLTRSQTKIKVYTKKEILKFVKIKLREVSNTQIEQQKILHIEELYKMLSENMWLVELPKYKKFKNTIQNKLIELYPDWERASHYHEIMFHQPIFYM